MAVRYICDRCGNDSTYELGKISVYDAYYGQWSPVAAEICDSCIDDILDFVKKKVVKLKSENVPSNPEPKGRSRGFWSR